MNISIKQQILNYLIDRGSVPGGILEIDVGLLAECKSSNVSRRCRELENEGKIQKEYRFLNGKKFVGYGLAGEVKQIELLSIPDKPRPKVRYSLDKYL